VQHAVNKIILITGSNVKIQIHSLFADVLNPFIVTFMDEISQYLNAKIICQ